MGLKLVVEPVTEPLSVSEAKDHLRITHTAEDSLIAGYVAAARARCEELEHRAYITQTWEITLDRFPCRDRQNPYAAIRLPRPPAQSVESVIYIDGDGTETTMDPALYVLKNRRDPALLVPAYGTTWPATRCEVDAVRVRYVAGYGDFATDAPERVRQAMRLYLGHYYANREGVVTGTIATELPEAAKDLLTDRMPAVES